MTGIMCLTYQWYDVERDPDGWDMLVRDTGENGFHTSGALAVHQYGKRLRKGILIKRGPRAVVAIGGLLAPHPEGGFTFETLSFAQPLDVDTPLLIGLTDWLEGQNVQWVSFGSFNGGVEGHGAHPPRYTLVERVEFPYDLSVDAATRWRQVSSSHRRRINRCQRAGCTVRRIDRRPAWIMAQLHRSWAQRKGIAHGWRSVFDSWCFYLRIDRHLIGRGQAALYGLFTRQGELQSAAYMLENGAESFYMIGASSSDGYRNGASIHLFWELAQHYPGIGIQTMNLGGVPASAARDKEHSQHGVFRFKAGFGIEPSVRHSLQPGQQSHRASS